MVMPLFLFILLSIFLGIQCTPSYARTAADVVYYHYRVAQQGTIKQLPLFPEEPTIAGFPKPLPKQLADLQALPRYYGDIVAAYQQEYEGLQTLARKTPITTALPNDTSETHLLPAEQRSILTSSPGSTTSQTLGERLDALRVKIEFYQNLAHASAELEQGTLVPALQVTKGERP
jgi:hypothetical protein